ncbi:MAG: helix-turn-helix transcriptional regulator [Halanaerobiales bacterium]|nr:helix-turn-helix transcriptional regulator [Halanaerobiales bacterium]
MLKSCFEFKVLAKKIQDFKKENKLTYEQIGNALGVDKSHVHRVINMETYPSLPFLIRLAEFMNLPLYILFIPTEKMIRQEFAEKMNKRIKELDWNYDEVEEKTSIPQLRLMDIVKGNSSPTNEELKTLATVLALKEGINYLEMKLNLMKSLLTDLDLKDNQIENILQYIKDNLK